MAKFNPLGFIDQVKTETKKVSWPTRKETIASTIAVFIMVTFAAIFLFFADQILAYVINLILSIGSN